MASSALRDLLAISWMICALFGDHATRYAEAEHAERVADAIEHVGLRGEVGGIVALRTQEDIQRFLDAHQVVLDRGRHRIEQGAVVPRDRALRVFDFAIARQQRIELV